MIFKHSEMPIKDSMAQGLNFSEAWLRALRLVVLVDLENESLEGIDFSPIQLTNDRGEHFMLSASVSSCIKASNDNNETKCYFVVSFEYDIDELVSDYDGLVDVCPTFDVKGYFENTAVINYEMEATEEVDPDIFALMGEAEFMHCEDEINTKCLITLESFDE